MGLDTSYNNISEVLSLLQKYKQNNYTNKFYNMIYLDNNNKVSIKKNKGCVYLWVFNATFNNITVISWWLVLLMEETRVPGENHEFTKLGKLLDKPTILLVEVKPQNLANWNKIFKLN
jgi:hypothetical protein